MKEFSIEEKAKAYDKKLAEAKEMLKDGGISQNTIDYIQKLYPELAESEDERIRKEIIDFVNKEYRHTIGLDERNRWIAWLEKQGEQRETLCDKCKKEQPSHSCQDITALGRCALEKQSEQKNKIQPKFKIGDIIRFKGNETLKGEEETHKIVRYDNELYVFDDGTTDLFCEQDLYELVEQKPAPWSEEDEENLKWFEKFFRAESVIAEGKDIPQDRYLWFKNLKDRVQPQPKQEWSEEDKMQLDAAIHLVSSTGHIETANWLKSIKNRVLQQNITVTDEELDKAKKDAYNDALDKIEYYSGEPTFDDGWSAAIWYLKKRNAQPQSQIWKPSDGQMDAITCAVRRMKESACYDSELLHLLQDLKKLREE